MDEVFGRAAGRMVIARQFEEAGDFFEGFAIIKAKDRPNPFPKGS